jgi:acetylornithine/succinyldiaminopimelate/putrescine aminotransferase
VETNIVVVRVKTAPVAKFVEKLHAGGVLVLATGPDTVRFVTNLEVSRQDIDTAVKAVAAAMK